LGATVPWPGSVSVDRRSFNDWESGADNPDGCCGLRGDVSWILAGAQDSGAESLESQLAAKYKLVKLGTDSTGLSVLEAGTVLVIRKVASISVPSGNAVILPSTVKDGQVHAASNTPRRE